MNSNVKTSLLKMHKALIIRKLENAIIEASKALENITKEIDELRKEENSEHCF